MTPKSTKRKYSQKLHKNVTSNSCTGEQHLRKSVYQFHNLHNDSKGGVDTLLFLCHNNFVPDQHIGSD